MEERFWNHLDRLVREHKLVIDRPAGSAHPRYPDFVYPFDYGYLQGTQTVDQGGIDVWAGSLTPPTITGLICTVDLQKGDAEIKILLGCTPEEAREIVKTHNQGPQAGMLILRDP